MRFVHIAAAVLALGLTAASASTAEARDGCGLGFHRGFYGYCRPNLGPRGIYGPYAYGPRFYGYGYRRFGGYGPRWHRWGGYGWGGYRRFGWHRWGGYRHAGWGGWHRGYGWHGGRPGGWHHRW